MGALVSRFSTCIFGHWGYWSVFSEARCLSRAPSPYNKATNLQSPALDKEQLQPVLLRRVTQVMPLLPWGAEKTRLHSSHGSVQKRVPKCDQGTTLLPQGELGSLTRDAWSQESSHCLSSIWVKRTLFIHTDPRAFNEWLIHFLKYLRNITFSLTIILAWEGLCSPS